jgi:hypothetical protein
VVDPRSGVTTLSEQAAGGAEHVPASLQSHPLRAIDKHPRRT